MRRVLAALVLASLLPGQQPSPRPPATPAQRLARELELPQRRAPAIDALLALGAPAVPALLQQARHPDLAVAHTAFEVLAALGHDGLEAVPELRELARGDTPHARAAAWTLARLPHRGTFLVPLMQGGAVIELDADGKEIARTGGFGKVWSVSALANGNLLAAQMDGARELDPAGKVVWQHDLPTVYTAERLIDGNTLLASFQRGGIVEVDPAGKEVWSFGDCTPLFATRLPNGLTLANDYNRGTVFEVGRDGKVAWKLDQCPHSYGCQRLRDGRTLVFDQRAGQTVTWTRDGKRGDATRVEQGCCALPLPDGSIQCGNGFVRRLAADGSERWKVTVEGWVGRVTLR